MMRCEKNQVATNYFVTFPNAIVMASLLFNYSLLYLHYHPKTKLNYVNNKLDGLVKVILFCIYEYHLLFRDVVNELISTMAGVPLDD